jgi:hypothetical protein
VLVSELVTNTVLHTTGDAELRVAVLDAPTDASGDVCETVVRVEVADRDPNLPRTRPTTGAEGGFGLRIVTALADRWGVLRSHDEGGTGKVVWFELRARDDDRSDLGE